MGGRRASQKGTSAARRRRRTVRGRLSAPPGRNEPANIAWAFAIATALLALTPLMGAAPPPPTALAPDFSVATTTGSSYALSSDLGARPLFVEFMHPDCSHCRNMGPALQSAHGNFGGSVRFVTVAVKLPGFVDPTTDTVAAFAARYGHAWTYGVDEGTRARDLYGVRGTPTFVFIFANGTVARTQPGEMPAADLGAALSAIAGG